MKKLIGHNLSMSNDFFQKKDIIERIIVKNE